jgi:hypothetical protein
VSEGPSEKVALVATTQKRVVADFMQRRNVVACGIGYKVRGSERTEEPCVMVSVTQKQPAAALSARDLIPAQVDGVLTDVIETGQIVALGVDRRSVQRPVRPGMSIGHRFGTAGTVACLVRRQGEVFIISNNHVLALLNKAKLGDLILQPGPGDGGTLEDAVGELAEFVPLHFLDETLTEVDTHPTQPGRAGLLGWLAGLFGREPSLGTKSGHPEPTVSPPTNTVDAALVSPLEDIEFSANIVDVGGPPLGMVSPRLGMRVMKSGRSSGITEGLIIQTDVTVDVAYEGRAARFVDQIMVSPLDFIQGSAFSERGDSGSLVLNYQREAVGLLFSGSDTVSVVNPLNAVLSALQVDLATKTH